MAYQIKMFYPTGETVLEEEIYETYGLAESVALDYCNAYSTGAESLELSGRYYEEEDCTYEILEV